MLKLKNKLASKLNVGPYNLSIGEELEIVKGALEDQHIKNAIKLGSVEVLEVQEVRVESDDFDDGQKPKGSEDEKPKDPKDPKDPKKTSE